MNEHELLSSLLCQLTLIVEQMSDLYEKHPNLNDDVDISKLIPMSLDDWTCELRNHIYNVSIPY